MKLVYVGTLPPHPGGTAIVGEDLLRRLAARGDQITAIAPITRASAAAGDPMADAPFELRRYFVPHFETSPNDPASEQFRDIEGAGIANELQPLLQDERPDLLVAGRETFAWHVAPLAEASHVPWVVLAQGGTTWGLVAGAYPEAVQRELLRRLACADRIVAVAHHLLDRLRNLGLERVAVVANAPDVEAFKPQPADAELRRSLGIAPGEVVVAHVSNLKALKRPLDLVKAAAIALARVPHLVFLVVGDGNERETTAAETRRLGIAQRFRFTGWVHHRAVASYLSLADMVVMPSQREALALVYLETQACGRLLIASDIAGAREAVEEGVTGMLFPVGDCAALAERIVCAAEDAELRARIGAQARVAARSRTLDTAIAEYQQIFSEVVQRGRH